MGIVERVRSLAEKNGHTIASVERELGFGQGSILTGEDQTAEKNADAIQGISDDALKVARLWDELDVPGKAIILGELYRRAEALAAPDDGPGSPLRAAR